MSFMVLPYLGAHLKVYWTVILYLVFLDFLEELAKRSVCINVNLS